jgi:hypothetical protein
MVKGNPSRAMSGGTIINSEGEVLAWKTLGWIQITKLKESYGGRNMGFFKLGIDQSVGGRGFAVNNMTCAGPAKLGRMEAGKPKKTDQENASRLDNFKFRHVRRTANRMGLTGLPTKNLRVGSIT